MWKSKMAGGGGNKNRFQYCVEPSGQEILYLRALQGHSGRNPIDPTLQDNALIPDNFFEYMYHIGCPVSLHSIMNSGLKAGGQKSSRERQTVFFTAVNLVNKEHKDPHELDLTKPRLAWYKQKKWKRHQDTVCWVVVFQFARRKGLKFYQTRCNAIIVYDTLPAYCISKIVLMESEEMTYEKVYVSLRPPPTISFKDKWMKEWDSEVAGSSKDSRRIQPKPKTQFSRTVRPVGGQESTKEIEKGTSFVTKTSSTQQERWDRRWARVHQGEGARHWLQSTRIATCSCERSRTSPSSRDCKKIENHLHREALPSRLAAE